MLVRIKDLPEGIDGVEAKGKVTREDYENVLKPLVEEADRKNRRIRLLYRLGPEFESFTPGAAWEDFSLGVKYLRLFERCVVVTDRDWIRHASQLMAPLVPCPFKVFGNSETNTAIEWLGTSRSAHNVAPRLVAEKQVLVVEVKGPLGREDFDAVSAEIDPWIEAHHSLHGLVIHAKRFPGWENLGSFFRHVEFVGQHHRKIERVALVADGTLPEVMPKLASYFVKAELKHFGYGKLESAIKWAAEGNKKKRLEERASAPRKSA